MRDNTTMKHVRTTTTGYIEADMLGQTLNVAEEMSAKQNTSQRPHRNSMKESKLSGVLEWSQTAPTACWRRLKALISFSNRYGRKLASLMRRKRINGK